MSEHENQAAFFDLLELNKNKYPFLKWIFAIPNGGHRQIVTAVKLKREGVRRGIFDVFICLPFAGKSGMFLEFKSAKGRLTKEQSEFRAFAELNGYATAVCRSWREAAREVEKYLEIELMK